MREIKFRGMNLCGKWVYGDLRHDRMCMPDGKLKDYISVCGEPIHPKSVGQFTGLTDLNGKEIYEGDIVEISLQFSAKQGLKRKFHLPAVVRWDERRARFVVISKEILDSIPDSECVSVIGNVHDNPELLEVEA